MLILTRRIGETLIIGDDVRVTVIGVQGEQVRIGIDAPKTTQVHRQEIYERIQAGQPQALAAQDAVPVDPRRARFLARKPPRPAQG